MSKGATSACGNANLIMSLVYVSGPGPMSVSLTPELFFQLTCCPVDSEMLNTA